MKLCEQVLLYAKGELNPAQKAAFEEHLKTCTACQGELKFLAKLEEGLVPPAAPQRAVDRLFARTTRKPALWRRFKTVWTATAAAAVVGVVVAISAFYPSAQPFSAAELVAYMNSSAEEEYTIFAEELTDMEIYFE